PSGETFSRIAQSGRSIAMLFKTLGRICVAVSFALGVTFILVPPTNVMAQQRGYDQSLLKGLQWRSIGPYRGGRSTAVAGVGSQANVFYFGATGGGVWKTTDGGNNWDPISDEFFKTGSVGAIGVSESDPN